MRIIKQLQFIEKKINCNNYSKLHSLVFKYLSYYRNTSFSNIFFHIIYCILLKNFFLKSHRKKNCKNNIRRLWKDSDFLFLSIYLDMKYYTANERNIVIYYLIEIIFKCNINETSFNNINNILIKKFVCKSLLNIVSKKYDIYNNHL